MEALTLTESQVRASAPSVFNTVRKEGLSDRYTPYCTWDIIQPLLKEGWGIYRANQSLSRDPNNLPFKQHSLRLSLPHLVIKGETRVDALITNSNDGTSKFRVSPGIWRYTCSNGAVVGDQFNVTAFWHRYASEQIQQASEAIVKSVPRIADVIDAWKSFQLSEDQKQQFIRFAVASRFRALQNPPDLNVVRRSEDQGDDLWHTFQRVQEGCLRGGQPYLTRTGRSVKTREIKSIGTNLSLNRQLWTAAETLYSGGDLALPA